MVVGVTSRAVAALAIVAAAAVAAAAPTAAASAERPNIVVVVTDDQTLDQFSPEVMPQTFRRLVDRGVSFRQAIVSTPQCCPSRAAFLTGQYAHNNEVVSNVPGYPALDRPREVMPSWLQRAGYRTIHVGKFLNGYAESRGARPAPGWDRWLTLIATNYLNPTFSVDGRHRAPGRYVTSEINERAGRLLSRSAKRRKPFYLQIDQLAPHLGGGREGGRCSDAPIPGPGDGELFADAIVPRTPAFNERDVEDKPRFLRELGPMSPGLVAEVDRSYGCALAALKAVDRGVADLVGRLRRSGELSRTMIVFTSDNGYSYGAHRVPLTKGLGYQEHLRVPVVIRPPVGLPGFRKRVAGRGNGVAVSNVDLAPTILAAAGARPCLAQRCRRLDGRSLLPLLRGRRGGRPEWTRGRAIPTSFDINNDVYALSCRWEGLWQPSQTLIHHLELPDPVGDACRPADLDEYYDLGSDPYQLQASSQSPAGLPQRLDALQRCSGIKGRDRRRPDLPFCE